MIPHALDKLAKSKYINKMDFMEGFHQSAVTPNALKLPRIICHIGIYEFKRMTFGLNNAPSHFQEIMDTIFLEKIFECWMIVCIDDIIISAEKWEEHVQYIERVSSTFTLINLKVLLKNFNFSKQELLELGRKVLGLSLAIDQTKVSAVLQNPVPKSINKIKSILGFSSYYRKHI
ncbi:hypothetical protein O181_005154 [Austropuccinia psidii MF-1]|uniref:Reverse transcriptase domain-containing protein n=1 Tax=Austropuccinia psidii MF-1 TaxID=1389203 RepID=A0A9Q3BHK4_9BASI|nr:hypothetical protein [Austropuccinia psidii MF-1]